MPCTAVSAACASSAASSASAASGSSPSIDGTSNRFERADFGRRQAEPREPRRPRAQDRLRLEWIESGFEPAPDRIGARGRKLLRHDDGGKTGETIRTPPQWRPSGLGKKGGKARIGLAKRGQRRIEIVFGMNMRVLHCFRLFRRGTKRPSCNHI